jgi:hypothetical protein
LLVFSHINNQLQAIITFMSETIGTPSEKQFNIPSYFAPEAFRAIRADFSGISYDHDALEDALELVKDRTGKKLPAPLSDVTFLYRRGEIGFMGGEERQLADRPDDARIFPADQLALPALEKASYITRSELEAEGKRAIQRIDISLRPEERRTKPMVQFLLNSLLWPPAEDMRMIASAGAWGRQFLSAFGLDSEASDDAKTEVLNEVVAQYPDAITLHPRLPRAA